MGQSCGHTRQISIMMMHYKFSGVKMFFEDCSASNLNRGSIYGYTRNVQCVYFCTQHNKMSLLKNLYSTKFVTAKNHEDTQAE